MDKKYLLARQDPQMMKRYDKCTGMCVKSCAFNVICYYWFMIYDGLTLGIVPVMQQTEWHIITKGEFCLREVV